jgi:hypothetical protein
MEMTIKILLLAMLVATIAAGSHFGERGRADQPEEA